MLREKGQIPSGRRGSAGVRRGFALVMTLTIMALLSIMAIGVLSLATVTVRSSAEDRYTLEARANARLAVTVALGELQKQLGPDQRVSAPASLLDSDVDSPKANGVTHPHWVGVWSHLDENGESVWYRDDANGGLHDRRAMDGWEREDTARSWLVSGNEGGREHAERFREPAGSTSDLRDPINLVAEGSLGDDPGRVREGRVQAERVSVETVQGRGHYAYWVGDLGTRANIATRNPYDDDAVPPKPLAELYEVLANQESVAGMMSGEGTSGPDLSEEDKAKLITTRGAELVSPAAREWMQAHFHDFTVHSRSVLADARQGGLKKDLTAYFLSDGEIAGDGTAWAPGLRDQDNLIGPANAEAALHEGTRWEDSRHRFTSPKFGLLRHWASLGEQVPHGGEADVTGIVPKSEPDPVEINLPGMASSNLNPATIASADRANLMPVLVEGSMFSIVSWHRNPPGWARLFNIRLHVLPRVVLWNPYNVELTVEDMMVLLHVNGRKEMATEGVLVDRVTQRPLRNGLWRWIWFIGGRSNQILPGQNILDSDLYTDPYIGSFFFGLERTTIGPGETLVFCPNKTAEYDHDALENNTLSARYAPDADLNYYFTASELGGGMDFYPTNYWFVGSEGENERGWNIKNQADDFRMMLKHRGSETRITPEGFDELPQVAYVSCSMQFGAGREPRFEFSEDSKEVMYETDLASARWKPRPGMPAKPTPNVRTRDGFRMRWFYEHESNVENSGSLTGTAHFETAHLANWNPRAAYSFRTPWDNLAGEVGRTGSGPWFFGSYTRDLFDQAVSWDDMMPVPRGGLFHGNPFGQPIEGQQRNVLFDVPRKGTGVMSLAQLQHVKLSEFSWHPAYAIGQAIVDPRVGTLSSAPLFGAEAERRDGGWDPTNIGWSEDAQRGGGREMWARFGRALAQNYAELDHLVYDLSYEANHSLWDSYFLSTGGEAEKRRFLAGPSRDPLPNGRHVLASATRDVADPDRLGDFHLAAYHLLVDGGFNVNSTSVEAWKAFLAATRNSGFGATNQTPFPRVLDAPEGELANGNANDPAAWAGFRSLDDDELERLAAEIVRQVKLRGPFLSLADFVNRRLTEDDLDERGRMGALQAAIEAAGINVDFRQTYPLENGTPLPDYQHPDNLRDGTRLEQTQKPDSKAWGAPGYLTQGDVLQVAGPALAARSDTFVIRAYGDAFDNDDKLRARAWCEVVVQRTPVPVNPSEDGVNPDKGGTTKDLGRRFTIQSFRWLSPDEI